MSGRLWIVIPNWDSTDDEKGFQHYKDRRPIWIKNYTELLAKPEYLELTLPQRGLLHGLWLMYAEGRREIPVSTSYVSRRLAGRVTKGMLDALNHAGFITYSASKPLAKPEHFASPEVEEEREEEKNPSVSPSTSTNNGTDGRSDDLDLAHPSAAEAAALLHLDRILKDIPA